MGKYTDSSLLIFKQFSSQQWKSYNVTAVPSDFTPPQGTLEYVRLSVLHNENGLNVMSTSGIIQIDIFTENGKGPARAFEIADMLDNFFSYVAVQRRLQTGVSALTPLGRDVSNPALQRHLYSTSFNYFGN